MLLVASINFILTENERLFGKQRDLKNQILIILSDSRQALTGRPTRKKHFSYSMFFFVNMSFLVKK